MNRLKHSLKFFGKAVLLSGFGAVIYGIALIAMDVLLASKYGTGSQAAVYQAAYQLPSTLISTLSGGVIFGILIPLFVNAGMREHHPNAQILLSQVSGFVLFSLLLVVVVLFILAPYTATLLAYGFKPALQAQVSTVMRWMLPILILHGLASVASAGLLALNKVTIVNLLPAVVPLAGILTMPFWGGQGARWVAWGYLAGTVVLAGLLMLRLGNAGYRVLPPARSDVIFVKKMCHLFGTSVLAYVMLGLLLPINLAFAGKLSAQDLSVFAYATKLVLLALAFITTIINSVGLPYFSDLVQKKSSVNIWPKMRQMIGYVFLLGLGLAFIWQALAYWVVKLIYENGQFSTENVRAVAAVQRIFVLQIPFYLVGIVCWRGLNAFMLWKPLVWASLAAIVVDIVANETLRNFHASGVASSYVIAIAVWSVVLFFYLRKHMNNSESPV